MVTTLTWSPKMLISPKSQLHHTQQQAAKSNLQLPTNEVPQASILNDIAVIPPSFYTVHWQQPTMPQPKGETINQYPLNQDQAPTNQAATK